MQKVSTVYLLEEPVSLDYQAVHKTISNKWEKKARELQKRRWQALKKLSRDEKI